MELEPTVLLPAPVATAEEAGGILKDVVGTKVLKVTALAVVPSDVAALFAHTHPRQSQSKLPSRSPQVVAIGSNNSSHEKPRHDDLQTAEEAVEVAGHDWQTSIQSSGACALESV